SRSWGLPAEQIASTGVGGVGGEGVAERLERGAGARGLAAEPDAHAARIAEEATRREREARVLRGEGGERLPFARARELRPGGGALRMLRGHERNAVRDDGGPQAAVLLEQGEAPRAQRVEVRHERQRERDARDRGRGGERILDRAA